jgi:hypothetical protein
MITLIDLVVLSYLLYSSGIINYVRMADEYIKSTVENGIYDIS